MGEREAADRLNLMPGYVAILERDDYQALRSPPFARGYVRVYGKLLGIDEEQLLDAFDRLREGDQEQGQRRVVTRPLQLQRTGLGVVTGLAILLLLVLALWWWQGGQSQSGQSQSGVVPGSAAPQSIQGEPVAPPATGEQ